jgi:TRAP-type C4-dicarboxylate transport system substrate-binding protein
MTLNRRTAALLAASTLSLPLSLHAQALPLRIASVVPRHSPYHQQLLELGESWRAAQGAGARFTVFTDGSQGGEAEIVRRMRIGQLQGGLLSVVGLRDIEPGVAALQNLPLLFRSWEELDHVREKLRADIEQRFLARGFVVIGWGDAGWVRFFSTQPALRPADFKGRKFFAWGSEPEQQSIMKSLGYTPVPLETADILPAIQTGMINVLPSTPYFALASQVYGTAKHMLEINWAPIVGALVVTQKAWDGDEPGGQQAAARGRREGRPANAHAGAQGGGRGRGRDGQARPHRAPPQREQLREWQQLAEQLYPRIRGTWCRPRPSTRCSPT